MLKSLSNVSIEHFYRIFLSNVFSGVSLSFHFVKLVVQYCESRFAGVQDFRSLWRSAKRERSVKTGEKVEVAP